jgi:hypothetical protein
MFVSLVVSLISVGVVYGTLQAQIKTLLDEMHEAKRQNERLIRLETKMDFIILQFKKQNDL